jgi:hypothetical protein
MGIDAGATSGIEAEAFRMRESVMEQGVTCVEKENTNAFAYGNTKDTGDGGDGRIDPTAGKGA